MGKIKLADKTNKPEFKQWQKLFFAHYEQSKIATGNVNLQRLFHDTCIDDNVTRIIDRETEITNLKHIVA